MYGSENLYKTKTIAFDFDQTISDHPELFLEIMEKFEMVGWYVIVVTYRLPDCCPEDLDFLKNKGYKVFFTGHQAKHKFMKSKGISVDIWVDDEPETIIRNWKVSKGKFYD